MNGWMIYYPWEGEKNKKFIEMFQEKGRPEGLSFSYVSVEDFQDKIKQNIIPDFVINRTRRPEVSSFFERKNIPVFHSAKLVELGNDKYKTYTFFKNKLPKAVLERNWAPKSWFIMEKDVGNKLKSLQHAEEYVIKAVGGHGGSQVFLTSQPQTEIMHGLAGCDCILQEKIESKSQDLRVYIVGGKIYAAVLRSGKNDFRSNFSLGGTVELYSLSQEQKHWINQFITCFDQGELAMVGIDFIMDSMGNLVFNEVEEMVGSRMLYQCSDKDIVKDYIFWIAHTFNF